MMAPDHKQKGPPGQTDPSQSRPAPQGSPDCSKLTALPGPAQRPLPVRREAPMGHTLRPKDQADATSSYLTTQLPRAGIRGATIDRDVIEEWLARSGTGPFDEEFADYVRGLTHVGGGTTFPGVSVPLPSQMLIGMIAWLEGQILLALGEVSDTVTLSGIGGIWMDELMLQLGIMMEPVLGEPSGPRDYSRGHNAELHPYADLAGFGPSEGRLMGETGALLAPAASGVISLA